MTRSSRSTYKTSKSTPTKMKTTKKPQQRLHHPIITPLLINSVTAVIKNFRDTTEGYGFSDKKVRYLEGKLSELEGCLFVTQRVNSLLEAEMDC